MFLYEASEQRTEYTSNVLKFAEDQIQIGNKIRPNFREGYNCDRFRYFTKRFYMHRKCGNLDRKYTIEALCSYTRRNPTYKGQQ